MLFAEQWARSVELRLQSALPFNDAALSAAVMLTVTSDAVACMLEVGVALGLVEMLELQ